MGVLSVWCLYCALLSYYNCIPGWMFILIYAVNGFLLNFMHVCDIYVNLWYTWVDQKVLKLVAYLLKIYNWIIPSFNKVCNYHFLICQCFQNDAVRSEVHEVIVWWRHASVTRSKKKKRPKLPFPSEVQSPTWMFHVAVIFFEIIMDLT